VREPVLIVEDDVDSSMKLTTWFSLLGVASITAHNGAEALRLARQHHPCLIILDFMMPGMGGEEFRERQLMDRRIADVPVVLTTAHPRAKEIARRLRVDGVVEKPVPLEKVEALAQKYCGSPDENGHGQHTDPV
jgi:CheY-like chemotaxis protein